MTTAPEAVVVGNQIAVVREALGDLRVKLEDLLEAHFENPDGNPIGAEAATRLVADAAILHHELQWFVDAVERLQTAAINVFYVESEADDA